jgi:hypothetical protein
LYMSNELRGYWMHERVSYEVHPTNNLDCAKAN